MGLFPSSSLAVAELRVLQEQVYALHCEQLQLANQARDVIYSYCKRADNDVKALEALLPPETLQEPSIEPTPRKASSAALNLNISSTPLQRKSSISTPRTKPMAMVGASTDKFDDDMSVVSTHTQQTQQSQPVTRETRETRPEPPPVAPAEEPAVAESSEEVFCTCRKPSWGDMVGCDGENCRYEWFHFECMGLRRKPKGKWYCPDCAPHYT
eukprot:g18471.t1